MCQGNGSGGSGGAGIHATASRNRIDSNTVMGNFIGIDSGVATANLIIRNSARGNTGSTTSSRLAITRRDHSQPRRGFQRYEPLG
jgi:parallel beta-helix repeat protein